MNKNTLTFRFNKSTALTVAEADDNIDTIADAITAAESTSTVAGISNATTIGRNLLLAADQAAERVLLGGGYQMEDVSSSSKFSALPIISARQSKDNIAPFVAGATAKKHTLGELQQFVQNMPYSLNDNLSTANTSALQDWHDELLDFVLTETGTWGEILLPAHRGPTAGPTLYGYLTDSLLCHPAVSWRALSRGSTLLKLKANATAVGTDSKPAMFYYKAVAQGTDSSSSWNPIVYGFHLDGNKGNQSAQAYGVYFERGLNDPDYLVWTPTGSAKCYSGPEMRNMEIENFSGDGVFIGGDRQRARLDNVRSINNGLRSGSTIVYEGHGLVIQGNDPVITCSGFGGNTVHNVLMSAISGVLFQGNNVWNCNPNIRSTASLAMHCQNCNGISIVNNVFNDCLSIVETTSRAKTVIVAGNDFRPADEVWTVDGTPLGITGTLDRNCMLYVTGAPNAQVRGNSWGITADATRPAYCIIVDDSSSGVGQVFGDIAYSTESSGTYIAPYATALFQELNNSRCFLDASNLNTGVTTKYSDFSLDGRILETTNFPSNMTNGGSNTIGNKIHFVRYGAGAVITSFTVTMPAAPKDGHRVKIRFDQSVTAVTHSGNGNTIISGHEITAAWAGQEYEYIYRASNTSWYNANAAGAMQTTRGQRILFSKTGVDFNVTTDTQLVKDFAFSNYIIDKIIVSNASISLTTAAGGVYTSTSKGGTAVVAAGQVYSALTTSAKTLSLTLNNTDVRTGANLYLSLTTGQGAAATADVYVFGTAIS